MDRIEDRMQALLADIDYDFSQFTLQGFARWLEARRGREILFVPFHFEQPEVSGSWLAYAHCDYVFYETENTPPLLQVHSQMHEMAHMVCGHTTLRIDAQWLQRLLNHFEQDDVSLPHLLRSVQHHPLDQDELEAEMLAALIQERVLKHARVQELFLVVSSDVEIAAYLEGLKVSWTGAARREGDQ